MIDLPRRVGQNIDLFTGRVWLLPKLLKWWDDSDERLFLLTGVPGTGKSMIMAWLAGFGPELEDPTARAQLGRLREVVKAAHFCQASSRNVAPVAFAEGIANQLTETVSGFSDALAATLADRISIVGTAQAGNAASGSCLTGNAIGRIDLGTLGDELSFDRAFTQPLKKLYASGHSKPMLLLVDGLDETLGYTGDKTLPELLSRLDDVPAPVRILATTRNEPRVLKFFRAVKPFDLVKDAGPDVDDVRTYAEGRLLTVAAWEEVTRNDFAQRLATQANGVFLYAAIVLDELLERSPSELPDLDTYPLPDGLSGLYHDFLTRELGKDEPRWFELYEPLLGLITVAQGEGLTARQLTDLIGKDLRAALRASMQYLTVELPDGRFRPFHKSFADFLLEDKDNLDYHIDAPSMHKRIAEHYWAKYHDDWSRIDKYGLQSLAIHLFGAEQFDRLAKLITQEWMHVRVEREDCRYYGFVADLTLAWQRVHEEALRQIEADQDELNAFASCIRYALIRTSINSLSSRYPPALIKRALETGVWEFGRALDVAAHVPDPAGRAEMYAAVLEAGKNRLTEAQRDEARRGGLTAARAMMRFIDKFHEKSVPIKALAALAPQLNSEQLDEALAAARAIKVDLSWSSEFATEMLRANALAALAPYLGGQQMDEALAAAQTIKDHRHRAEVLKALALQLNEDAKTTVLGEALAAARAIVDERSRVPVLTALLPHLSDEAKSEALGTAMAIKDKECRAEVLTVLAPHLDDKAKTETLGEALAAARAITGEGFRVRVLTALLPHLSAEIKTEVLAEVLAAVRSMGEESRAQALTALLPHLSGEAKTEVLAEAPAMKSEYARAGVLVALAPYLSGEQLDEVLATARAITSEWSRVEVLTALLPHLSAEIKTEVLAEVLAAVRSREEESRAQALTALLPHLSGEAKTEVLVKALAAARAIANDGSRAREIGDEKSFARALAALAPHLSSEQFGEALSIIPTSEGKEGRAKALMALVPRLSGVEREAALREALGTARATKREVILAQALAVLAPHLNGQQLDEALSEAWAIKLDWARAQALTALAPHLSGEAKTEVLGEARVAARMVRDVGDGSTRAGALAAVVPHLNGEAKTEALGEALRAASWIKYPHPRARAMAALTPHLSGEQLGKALAWVRKIEDDRSRAEALPVVVPHLSGEQLGEALDVARAIKGEWAHAKALAVVAPYLGGEAKTEALAEALATARAIKDEGLRAQALGAVAESADYPTAVLRDLRRSVADHLWKNLQWGTTREVHEFCSQSSIFHQPIVGTATLGAIASHITEIGSRWDWL